MRLRLILSFVLLVIATVTGVIIIARQGAASEVRSFMGSGMLRLDALAQELEDYYQQTASWQGAEALFEMPGHGGGQGFGAGGQGMMGSGMMMNQGLALVDANGNVLLNYGDPNLSDRMTAEQIALSIPLKDNGQVVGYLHTASASRFTASDQQFLVQRLTRAALIAGLAAGGLALMLALYLAYRLLQPVNELRKAAQQVAQGDLTQRVPVRGHDELADLASTFNQMANSLQKAQESRRAMTADIAHELRTPLAVQRASLEALQDGVYPLTVENLAPLLEQNHLLNHLVEDLRTLALADAGQLRLDPVPLEMINLLERVTSRFLAQASAQRVEIQILAQPGCPEITADPTRLEQILGNLLSNALRYTPAGGRIMLGLACTKASIQVTVQDSGPGIPIDALPYVFERFYRADRARARSEGGSGLGLAIARQLTQAHQGTLEVGNAQEGGAKFTLTLPTTATYDKK